MGPGCFYPGNEPLAKENDELQVSFNGAGMFLSRKYLQFCSCSSGAPSFNGAGMFLSRKCIAVAPQAHHSGGFNGAGMFLSRKYPDMFDPDVLIAASMGPGCFYPGNIHQLLLVVTLSRRFNGAGMFLSRK